jgi:hypothetical protein
MSVDDDIKRGRLAEAVLTNSVYTEAYSLIEQGILTKWRESTDKDEREELHKLLKLLDKVKALTESAMRSGQVAAKELERKRSLSERVGMRLRGS